jgi:pimeloyl-ACP methyl ester carboxylesterase
MDALGHPWFAVAGHDTGMWIGYALAADHPDRVGRLAVAEAAMPGVSASPPLFGSMQAGLEVGENAAVRSHELFQLAAVFGLIQDDRWLVGFLEREQLTAQALRPGLQGRACGPVGHGDESRAPRR